MALLERTDALAAIREKVEARERLDYEDGVALMESDDLLGLGELADLARRVRGATTASSSCRTCTSTRPTSAG